MAHLPLPSPVTTDLVDRRTLASLFILVESFFIIIIKEGTLIHVFFFPCRFFSEGEQGVGDKQCRCMFL